MNSKTSDYEYNNPYFHHRYDHMIMRNSLDLQSWPTTEKLQENGDGQASLEEKQDKSNELPEQKSHEKDIRLGDIFASFANHTSMHAIPYILRAKTLVARVLWTVVFLAGSGVMIWHLVTLTQKYLDYNINSRLTIKYENLIIPSVTVCNNNPFRNSLLTEDNVPRDFLMFVESRKYDTSYQTDKGNNKSKRRKKREIPIQRNLHERKPPRTSQTYQDRIYQDSIIATRNIPKTSPSVSLLDEIGDNGGKANETTKLPSFTTKSSTISDDTHSSQINSSNDTTNNHYNSNFSTETVTFEVTTNKATTAENYTDVYNPSIISLEQFTENDKSFFGSGNISEAYRREEEYASNLRNLTVKQRITIGHDIKSLVVDCSVNGIECSEKNFSSHLSKSFGNCFTFNDFKSGQPPLQIRGSGTTYGLNLLIYIERNEYVEGLHKGEGATFDIHPFGTKSNVLDHGQSLNPGMEAYVSIQMKELTRYKGHSHSCFKKDNYKDLGYKYTQTTCNSICLDQLIAEKCNCYRPENIENYNYEQTTKPSCAFDYNLENCQKQLKKKVLNGALNCSCEAACHSIDYDLELSSSNFPPVGLWYELVNKVCQRNPIGCEYLKKEGKDISKREKILRENFIRLRLYFKDLNNQFIEENLEYDTSQFLSDFGGLIGLWIGMSVITIIEIGDLLMALITFTVASLKRDNYLWRRSSN
ncbi:DgyrCDS2734 [Dimorphilus gyrociliatus]|uniref:DgyrCDS2734 n=1 Tax=Dimorphilus gyrociliatus TaxID=2664684 RepID=A0A7I8VD34_9ANNE|nr:DgyrCDS2734 [Dimorphilus gyrociliatus]